MDAAAAGCGWWERGDLLTSARTHDPIGSRAFFSRPTSESSMPRPAVNVAVRAAGQIILRYMNRLDSLEVVEKQRHDYVSEVDRLAETEIIRELKRAFPRDAMLAEESGASGKSRNVWVIDPLDGTHNYLRGLPHFCVSIGLLESGEPTLGVVYDPLRVELFTAD